MIGRMLWEQMIWIQRDWKLWICMNEHSQWNTVYMFSFDHFHFLHLFHAGVLVLLVLWNSIIVDQFQIANIYIQLVMPCGNKMRTINLSNRIRRNREQLDVRVCMCLLKNERKCYIFVKYHLIHIEVSRRRRCLPWSFQKNIQRSTKYKIRQNRSSRRIVRTNGRNSI